MKKSSTLLLLAFLGACNSLSNTQLDDFLRIDKLNQQLSAVIEKTVEGNREHFRREMQHYYWIELEPVFKYVRNNAERSKKALTLLRQYRDYLLDLAGDADGGLEDSDYDKHEDGSFYPRQCNSTSIPASFVTTKGAEMDSTLQQYFKTVYTDYKQLLEVGGSNFLGRDTLKIPKYLSEFKNKAAALAPLSWQQADARPSADFQNKSLIESLCLLSQWEGNLLFLDKHFISSINQHFIYTLGCEKWHYCRVWQNKEVYRKGDDFKASLSVGLYRENLCTGFSDIIVTVGKDTVKSDADGLARYSKVSHTPGTKRLEFYFYEKNNRTGRVHDWGRNYWYYEVVDCK